MSLKLYFILRLATTKELDLRIRFNKMTELIDLTPFNGAWELYEYDSDNLEIWMKKMNIPWAKRKIGKSLKRTFTFTIDPNNNQTHFRVQSVTKVTSKDVNVVIDQPQDDVSVEGRKMKSVFTVRNGNLVNVDKWQDDKGNDVSGSYTFSFEGKDVLCVKFDYAGLSVLQKYKKV